MVDGDDFDVAVASRRPAAELELTIMKGIETGIECHTDESATSVSGPQFSPIISPFSNAAIMLSPMSNRSRNHEHSIAILWTLLTYR